MKRIAIITGLMLAALSASAQRNPDPGLLFDSTGAPYPNASGTALPYIPGTAFTCYTLSAGVAVPCNFSGGGGSFNALTGDATSTSTGGATTVKGINGTLLSGLSTGILKNTTTTGVPSIAAANTDYLAPNGTTTGTPALSVSALESTAAFFSGGSGTTTFPYWMIQPSGTTAATTWSTGGTLLGLNCPSGAGNALDIHNNGGGTAARFNCSGALVLTSTVSGATSITSALYASTTNCAGVGTAASPSVVTCAAAPAGAFSCATNASAATCTINTSAVTANSVIIVQEVADESTRLSVTCNTAPTANAAPLLATKTGASGFTINMPTITVNPACFDFWIIN